MSLTEEDITNGQDNWAKVELYRWQHGELPLDDGTVKPWDACEGLRAGAGLLSKPETCPTTFNVSQVMHFAAREIEQLQADLRNANERATEWEGIAAGRLVKLEDTRAELQGVKDADAQGQRDWFALLVEIAKIAEDWNELPDEPDPEATDAEFQEGYDPWNALRGIAADIKRMHALEAENSRLVDDHIKDTNEIGTLAAVLVEDLGEKSTGESVCVAAARLLLGDKERLALLTKTLRFIEHVDKTPFYGCSGTRADKDRRGQLPKAAGQRWKTPREMVRDLQLPAESK